eukprot:3293381-Pyramimonas_sp.AAC.1
MCIRDSFLRSSNAFVRLVMYSCMLSPEVAPHASVAQRAVERRRHARGPLLQDGLAQSAQQLLQALGRHPLARHRAAALASSLDGLLDEGEQLLVSQRPHRIARGARET